MGRKYDALGVYLHIPFCVQKCKYCDFLSGAASGDAMSEYVSALSQEIMQKANQYRDAYEVCTIYFGGGTPSLLPAKDVNELLELLRQQFVIAKNAEITLEANPGTLNQDKLKMYLAAGINRLSIGMQSTFDDELRLLGRIHTYQEFLDQYKLAVKLGFSNINVDLMMGLPGQTLTRLEQSVNRLIDLEPKHISVYSLILEEGTAFAKLYQQSDLPQEEIERTMYDHTRQLLEQAGYIQYELSNYAKPGYESRHNSSYWIGIEYLGLGLGASSYMRQTRFKNTDDMKRYKKCPGEPSETEEITKRMQMEEFMFLGLRMSTGISYEHFHASFGISLNEVYQDVIEKHVSNGLLTICENEKGRRLKLTKKGMDVCNYVFADFIAENK
ncbi:MAG: oxygen-independent coproporphyrinogen III oxidase [Clostridia bacterium]|nr:oxygen-independent coproporphyrinogen III oxidase [Clostridia bacterium]